MVGITSVLAVLVAGLAVAHGAPAGASSLLGPSVEVLAPSNTTGVSHSTLAGIACATVTSCVAVGSYEDTSRAGLPMIATKTVGGWSRAISPSLPADHADTYSTSGLAAISCTAPRTCVAVGSYESASRSVLPMVVVESAGSWGAGFTIGLPPNAGGNQLAYLTSVSCVAAGTCTAVGSFTDSYGTPELLAASATAGSWGAATEVALPPGSGSVARSLGSVGLTGVSCTDATDCVAVGSYLDRAGAFIALHVAETKGVWQAAARAALPQGTPLIGSAALDSVSCTAVSDCVAVGSVTDAAGHAMPVVERESHGAWARAVAIDLPSTRPAASAGALSDVVCAARSCIAVGELVTTGGMAAPVVLVNDDGQWQPLQQLDSLAAADPHPAASGLTAVACAASNACIGVGDLRGVSAQGAVTSSVAMAARIVPVRPVVDPAPPTHVAVAPRPSALFVTWVPSGDGGSAAISFSATASPGGATCTSPRQSCVITSLHDGTRYSVVVTATNVHGTSRASAPSLNEVPGTVPTAPHGLVVTQGHDRTEARWRASTGSPGDPVTRYVAIAATAGSPPHRCASAATSCALVGLVRGDTYTVWVVAYNAVGPSARSASRRFTSR